jgi:hypothetical protein
MTFLGQIRIGTTARALAAALAIGGALVSLAPGEAQAARKDNGVRCAVEGHVVGIDEDWAFYLPGETIGSRRCESSGEWRHLPPPERGIDRHGRLKPGR